MFSFLKISLESIKSTCNLLINNPKVPGKYQLPDKHIFESIKQFILLFPDEVDIDHNSLRLANAKLLNVNECNNYYNQEFGQEMERLYENEDILLGVAGSRDRTGTLEEFAKSFFEEGLLSNKEYHESLDRVIQMQVNEKGNKKIVEFDFGNYPVLALWSIPGAPYICIEPWYNFADKVKETGYFKDKEGIITLEPNKEFETEFVMKF